MFTLRSRTEAQDLLQAIETRIETIQEQQNATMEVNRLSIMAYRLQQNTNCSFEEDRDMFIEPSD